MARTKRTAAAASTIPDENTASHAEKSELAPLSESSKPVHESPAHDQLTLAKRPRTRRSKASKDESQVPFAPDPIDDPIPIPTSFSLTIDPARHVLTLGDITFPDIDPDTTDRKFWQRFAGWSQSLETARCEYPARAQERLKSMYEDVPAEQLDHNTKYEAAVYSGRKDVCEQRWMQDLKEEQKAKESGVIPAANESDVLLFESFLNGTQFRTPPSLSDYMDESGVYTGFQRAIVAELTEVLIRPVMYVRRPVIMTTTACNDVALHRYEYEDPDERTQPKYQWVTYKHPTLLNTSAEFDALTPAAFTAQVQADPYHEQSKLTKPLARKRRANHAYPLPHKDHTIESRVAWILPPKVVDGVPTGSKRYFVLEEHCEKPVLLKHIRPEMMPFLRIVVRPISGEDYSRGHMLFAKYRWSVYLRTDVVNEVLRAPRAENAAKVAAIRDVLGVVAIQEGWITSSNEDGAEALGPGWWGQWGGLNRELELIESFPNIRSAARSLPPLPQMHDRVANPARLEAICERTIRGKDAQQVLAWLLDRERPETQRLDHFSSHSIRVKHPVIRLGPTGMYYEPFSGLFSDTLPSHVVIQPLQPSSAPLPTTCTDSVLDIDHQNQDFKRTLISSLIHITTLASLNAPSPRAGSTAPPDYFPCRATLLVCPAKYVDNWVHHTTYSAAAGARLNVISIRTWKEYLRLDMDQLCAADVVIVSVDFLLAKYKSALFLAANGPLHHAAPRTNLDCYWSAGWDTRRYFQDAGSERPPDSIKTSLSNLSSQADLQDAFETFGEPKDWDADGALLDQDFPSTKHMQSCPVLLHKVYWRRLVFDKVSRTTNEIYFSRNAWGDNVGPPTYCGSPRSTPTPLRELLAESSVTLIETSIYDDCMEHRAKSVYEKLALCPGDAPPVGMSRRSQREIVCKVALNVGKIGKM